MKTEPLQPRSDIDLLSAEVIRNFHIKQEKTYSSKKCAYAPGGECYGNTGLLEICAACPYGMQTTFKGVVKNFYKKVIGLAIDLLKRDLRFGGIFRDK